jgi:hypothetical protein
MLCDVETGCRNRLHVWLLRIVGALTAPTSMALPCRWRSRPQHQLLTHAVQQTAPLFDHRVGTGEFPGRCKAVSGVCADNGSGLFWNISWKWIT